MKLAIVGAGGHGKVVADTALELGSYRILGFFDDDTSLWNRTILGFPVLGPINSWADHGADALAMAIGSNSARKSAFDRLKSAGAKLVNVVHPRASLGRDVVLGEGVVAFSNVVLNAGTRIDSNCILNTACTIDHDCVIGSHVHIAPGVNIAGGVCLGDGVFVGIGARIIPGISVGDWAIIGAGAVVTRDVRQGAKVVGVPAREVGDVVA